VFRCLLLRWQCDHARRSDLALAPGAIRSRALAHRHLAFEPYPTISKPRIATASSAASRAAIIAPFDGTLDLGAGLRGLRPPDLAARLLGGARVGECLAGAVGK
jgi:hypothetical protein